MSTIVGIDPGKKGAAALIDPEKHLLWVYDMPILLVGSSDKRWEVDGGWLADRFLEHDAQYALLEDVWSMTGDGNVGAFSFGAAFGVVLGVCQTLNLRPKRVRPQVWKKNMRAPADKAASKARAIQLQPDAGKILTRMKDDGRAEAIMIAMYHTFNLGFQLKRPLTLMGCNDEKFDTQEIRRDHSKHKGGKNLGGGVL